MKFKLIETVTTTCDLPPPGGANRCGRLEPGFYRGGYGRRHRLGELGLTVFNAVLAGVFILLGLPLFVLLACIIKGADGGPIFYRGTRLGQYKIPFFMYKFRTLPVGAQKNLGALMVSGTAIRLNPFVRLLRDVRLDELPQLFNILKGDMDFVGPRPLRPELYEAACRNIPNFDLRFTVRPGLIGFSQLFTPHSTPKRLRAIIDNKFIFLKRSFTWDIFIIFYTIVVLARAIVVRGWTMLARYVKNRWWIDRFQEKRTMERQSPNNVTLLFDCPDEHVATTLLNAQLVDINEAYCRIDTNCKLSGQDIVFTLSRMIKSYNKKRPFKKKTAHCQGILFKEQPGTDERFQYSYVVEYRGISPFNAYIIDKYLLNKSIM